MINKWGAQVLMQSAGITSPPPSQAETLMSTQDAKERAETRAAAKGKGKEAQAPPSTTTQSPAAKAQAPMGPPAKPSHLGTPNKQHSSNATTLATSATTEAVSPAAAPDAPANTPTSKNTTSIANTPGTPADVPAVTPQKRGPGRPRKPELTDPPPSKRPRGRPRNSSTPASNTRQRAREENADSESEYRNSGESSSETLPPDILSQYTAHVTILRTRLDSRGIPEQYSLFKSFWVPVRSSYFDGGASSPAGRFVYWDPLFITSVACPVCQQPLAIAAGGGWLDEPLSMRDEEGPCWIIGRRYVCTQCFAATEVAARYVDDGHLDGSHPDPNPSGPSTADVKPKAIKIDFSSPVYYISWEKRFRELLPPALAAEFPTRVRKRAAKEKDQEKEKEKEDEAEEDAEGELDLDTEETPRRAAKRARHCMKCGSKTCQGRMARSRCPNACHDCGSTECNGRPKPNVTCKGEASVNFKELNTDESSSPMTERSGESSTPALPQSISWPSGLPEVPSGFVLAIPYAVGADGKPSGTGTGMAYLVPQENVPGLVPGTKPNATVTEASGSTPEAASAPSDAAPPAQPQRTSKPKGTPRAKQTSQKTAAQAQSQPQAQAQAQVPLAPAPHPRPPHHPPSHGAPYPPPPPGVPYLPYPPHPSHSGGPEPGHYGGYYPTYGYPPPYGYGFYPPYPPHHAPSPASGATESNAPPPHPPYAMGPYSGPPGYAGPPGAGAYTPVVGPHDAPPPAPTNGYAAPPAPGPHQPHQYIAYHPPATATTTTTPATKKRKVAAIAEGEKPT